jgi:hypothetical protein
MTPAPVNVFCAGTLWHLLVMQVLAARFRKAGERNALVLTRPTLRADQLHVRSFAPYRRLLLDELWDAVLADDRITARYDVRAVQGGIGAVLRARGAQGRLDAFAGAHGAVARVLVTNPMTSAVDRRVAGWGRRRGATVHFVEDGTGSYLPPRVKHDIDRSYWELPARGGSRVATALAAVALDATALRPPSPFDADLRFDVSHVVFPDRFPRGPHSGTPAPVDHDQLRAVLERLAPVVPVPSAATDGVHVYLSRPDSEDGLLTREDEVELIGAALAALAADRTVVLKPHPRDGREKVAAIAARAGIEVVDDDPHPAELYLTATRAAGCYGTWSGSMIYARELLGIPARSLLPGLCARLEERGRPAPALTAVGSALAELFPTVFVLESS